MIRCGFRPPIPPPTPPLQYRLIQIVNFGDLSELKSIIEHERDVLQEDKYIDWVNDTLLTAVLHKTRPNVLQNMVS